MSVSLKVRVRIRVKVRVWADGEEIREFGKVETFVRKEEIQRFKL